MFSSIGRDNRILMLALLLWALGEGLWLNLRSIYIKELGATPGQVGLVLAIEGFARLVAVIPGGWLADRYGPLRIMLASWLMGIVAALVAALAPDWRWMIPQSVLYGGSFLVLPALTSYTLLATPWKDDPLSSARTLTTVHVALETGLVFSQPLGGLVASRYGIRSTYWIAIVLFAISTVVVLRLRHYPVPREAVKVGWRALTRNRPFVALVIFFFLVSLGMTLGWPLTPIFLHDVRGFSLGLIGLFAALLSVGAVVWNLTLGRVRPRWGLATTLGLVWLAMLILLRFSTVLTVSLAYLMLGAIYTSHLLMNAAIARRVTPAQRGLAFGIVEVGISLGMALSPRIAGALYEIRPHLPFVASLVVIPAVAASSIALLSILRQSAVQTAPSANLGP